MTKKQNKYGLDCSYFTKTYDTIEQLIEGALAGGVDPSMDITLNGKPTGEQLIDQMVE